MSKNQEKIAILIQEFITINGKNKYIICIKYIINITNIKLS